MRYDPRWYFRMTNGGKHFNKTKEDEEPLRAHFGQLRLAPYTGCAPADHVIVSRIGIQHSQLEAP